MVEKRFLNHYLVVQIVQEFRVSGERLGHVREALVGIGHALLGVGLLHRLGVNGLRRGGNLVPLRLLQLRERLRRGRKMHFFHEPAENYFRRACSLLLLDMMVWTGFFRP